jgi:peptidyl-prolyl cis-trans isomerase B (cyclophilin B)
VRTRLVLCASLLATLALAGCPKNPSNPASSTPPEEKKSEPAKTEPAKTAPVTPAAPEKAVVELSTTMGKIKLELDGKKAPQTVANFLQYVRSGHYNGTIFHRVISTFMIQGGGFDANMVEKTTRPPIQNEAQNGLSNDRGTVAMARTPNPHSAGAQFFINVNDNPNLNHRDTSLQGWGYCVFGKVTDGMDVVDKIKAVETEMRGGHENVPKTPVVINEAKIVSQ